MRHGSQNIDTRSCLGDSNNQNSSIKSQSEDPNPSHEIRSFSHDATYVDAFLEEQLDEKEMRRIGLTPWTPKMIERTLCLTGGAVEATIHAVKHGGITETWQEEPIMRTEILGQGYCVFNDLAISAMYAIEHLGMKRVAILDLDVHQGDGTATILSNEERTRTISVHCSTNFPFRKSVSDYDLPIEPNSRRCSLHGKSPGSRQPLP